MKNQFTKRYETLLKVKGTKRAKIGRGQDFEKLINDVLEDENILIKRSYYTSDNQSEQIDGAIEVQYRIILIEVKWVESNLAASELYAFIGKVENKLVGSLGLFISKEKLSDNFINSIVKGRKRSILLLHGEDIDLIFNKDICIKDYLEYCIKRYSYDNLLHFSVKKWLEREKTLLKETKANSEIEKIDKSAVKNFLKTIIINNSVAEYEILLDLEDLKNPEVIKIAEFLLQRHPTYYTAYTGLLSPNRNKYTNVRKTLINILSISGIPSKLYVLYFKLYIENPTISYLHGFLWEPFKKYYKKLESSEKFKFEKAWTLNI